MAAGASQTLAILRKRLTNNGVKKRGSLLRIMALDAVFFRAFVSHLVAVATHSVDLLVTLVKFSRSFTIVTKSAFFLPMAILAGKLEKLDVFYMLKGYYRQRIFRCDIRLCNRRHDYRNAG